MYEPDSYGFQESDQGCNRHLILAAEVVLQQLAIGSARLLAGKHRLAKRIHQGVPLVLRQAPTSAWYPRASMYYYRVGVVSLVFFQELAGS
jgi:hypothetical protein